MDNSDSKRSPLRREPPERLRPVRWLKRLFYGIFANNSRKLVSTVLVVGIVAGILYLVLQIFTRYAVASSSISLVYPEISDGKYPDGSRFTAYDLISNDRLETALAGMQMQGKYLNFTVEDLAENIVIASYLEDSVSANVSSARSAGLNYSYVANEYSVSFVQPHDFKATTLREKLFTKDDSVEFLNLLIDANLQNIRQHCGGMDGFNEVASISGLHSLDYSERFILYKTRLDAIIAFLNKMNANSGGYTSAATGKSIKDLINMYSVLYNERLDTINSFVETSGVSKDLQVLLNKLSVQLENNQLSYAKARDYVDISRFAKDAYDHTFTENIIVVSTTDEQGLYQARPKTEYDLVVNRYNQYSNSSFESKDAIVRINEKIVCYSKLSRNAAELSRLTQKCNQLWEKFDADYAALGETAARTVSDYLTDSNQQYMVYETEPIHSVTLKTLVKTAAVAFLGMMLAFSVFVILTGLSSHRKLMAKKRLLDSIRGTDAVGDEF